MYAVLHNVRVDAVYVSVPARAVRIDDELQYYGGSLKKAERARTMIGTDIRRVAFPGITASDMCASAARRLMEQRCVDRECIDTLIFVSQSPDYDQPATACVLQHTLGLPQTCATFDVNQGCAGYVYGLWLAASIVGAGGCRNALLLVGDAPYRPRDPRNRIMAPIFGDGGSATLLTRDESAAPLCFSLGNDGSGYETIIQPAGRARMPFSSVFEENKVFFEDITDPQGQPWRLSETYMDGAAVFDFTLRVVPRHINAFLQQCGETPDTLDWLVLHQANKQIVLEIAKRVGMPEAKTPWQTFSRYGNLASASIPAALCDMFGSAGTSGRQKMLLCGFGIGLSWGSCLMDTPGFACAPVFNYERPTDAPDTASLLAYWRARFERGKQ